MAPSKPLLQTSESSTQEPTTVTTCENTENTPCTCDTVVEEETKESDSGGQRKGDHQGDTGTGAQTTADGIGNVIVEDNTQIENTPCTCDTVVEEETEESDSGNQEKADHQGDTGRRPQTTADGIGNAIVEDNTQTENTPCTCDTVVEEETEESDSGEEENEQNGTEESGFNGGRKATHTGDKGKPPQSTINGTENGIIL
ncbi:uncharacterized protein LOC106779465 [Vigna radiata var. radiata]|uniref:Uncharacterized protein LOC106779465 n=1 Tax=Vigna radiata var. radiata TaxID=3916 RepID=A0A1S3VXL6_VIGRR|nr:uncharacterized protein LOC106779465 [Vigna radiata var. radiata]